MNRGLDVKIISISGCSQPVSYYETNLVTFTVCRGLQTFLLDMEEYITDSPRTGSWLRCRFLGQKGGL